MSKITTTGQITELDLLLLQHDLQFGNNNK
jgi:hypothetical protein